MIPMMRLRSSVQHRRAAHALVYILGTEHEGFPLELLVSRFFAVADDLAKGRQTLVVLESPIAEAAEFVNL